MLHIYIYIYRISFFNEGDIELVSVARPSIERQDPLVGWVLHAWQHVIYYHKCPSVILRKSHRIYPFLDAVCYKHIYQPFIKDTIPYIYIYIYIYNIHTY